MIDLNIKTPNLPLSRVTCIIVDCNAPQSLFAFLKDNNIECIKSKYIENTIESVSTHPDMQICHIGGNKFVCEPSVYEYYCDALRKFDVEIIKGENFVKSNYPYDISYNVVITDKFLMHNYKYTDSKIQNYALSNDISILNVKQGYTKCATCVIDNNAIITSDSGIYETCVSVGIDCLLIENDKIKLGDRYDGFIGGCCGMIDYKTLLFCGDISSHNSYEKIVGFANKYGVSLISSADDILTDVGSIIPVVQL